MTVLRRSQQHSHSRETCSPIPHIEISFPRVRAGSVSDGPTTKNPSLTLVYWFYPLYAFSKTGCGRPKLRGGRDRLTQGPLGVRPEVWVRLLWTFLSSHSHLNALRIHQPEQESP